jgi:hypothetical protein
MSSAAAVEAASKWADPQDLHVGKTYRLSTETPLMPELSPTDPMQALERVKQIGLGGTITVLKIGDKGGTPWYEVQAKQADGVRLGRGWVNSIALLGQDIGVVK